MRDLRDELAKAARGWVDVPYKHLGRTRYGVDCVGLLIKSAHEVGFTTYDTTNYGRRPQPKDFLRELKDQLDRIQKREAGHGDVLVFREPRHPCHVGILDAGDDGRLHVVHAYAPMRKVVREPMTDERWSNAVMGFRVPGT
jgi:cell wall-associated NlpC family hydrolase